MKKPGDNHVSFTSNSTCPTPAQESSWASYIADFITKQPQVKGGGGEEEESVNLSGNSLQLCENGYKKRKITRTVDDCDDSLSDTATSNPNITYFKSKVERGGMRADQVVPKSVSPKSSCGGLDLRKKGLCLMPLSLVLDYFQQINCQQR